MVLWTFRGAFDRSSACRWDTLPQALREAWAKWISRNELVRSSADDRGGRFGYLAGSATNSAQYAIATMVLAADVRRHLFEVEHVSGLDRVVIRAAPMASINAMPRMNTAWAICTGT